MWFLCKNNIYQYISQFLVAIGSCKNLRNRLEAHEAGFDKILRKTQAEGRRLLCI